MLGIVPAHIFALVINVLSGIGISLSVIFIILAGIQYMASMGNKEKAERARHALIHSIVGLIVVLSAITIVYVVGNTLGMNVSLLGLSSFIPF